MKSLAASSVHRFYRRRLLGGSLALVGGCAIAQADDSDGNCSPTARDALGPFYVADTPFVENLSRHGRAGEVLAVSGEVRAAGTDEPVADAVLEVWQTDAQGNYHPAGNGPADMYDDAEIDLRGKVRVDASGLYAYLSLVPAPYRPRPRHIHYRVSAPGFQTLVTQHYLSDGESVPGGPCRSGSIDRSSGQARFDAPPIYLRAV